MNYYKEFVGEDGSKITSNKTWNPVFLFCLIAYVLTVLYLVIFHQEKTFLESHVGGCLISGATAFYFMSSHLRHSIVAMVMSFLAAFIPILISVS